MHQRRTALVVVQSVIDILFVELVPLDCLICLARRGSADSIILAIFTSISSLMSGSSEIDSSVSVRTLMFLF